MASFNGKAARRSILRRVLTPSGLIELRRRRKSRGRRKRVEDDPELKLYARMLDKEYLHLGYFDDPTLTGEDISFGALMAAQARYGAMIVERVRSAGGLVLDGGCGMGGLLAPLQEAGHRPVALTPDRSQIAHISSKFPDLPVEHSTFEGLDTTRYARAFDTIINSESWQYIDLDAGLAVVDRVLAPGGRWVICDFFRETDKIDRAGHKLEVFRAKTAAAGWRLIEDNDITPNILPTLAFAHMLGRRLIAPLVDYGMEKLQLKAPGVHYVFEEILARAGPRQEQQLEVVELQKFAANKTYRLFVLERG